MQRRNEGHDPCVDTRRANALLSPPPPFSGVAALAFSCGGNGGSTCRLRVQQELTCVFMSGVIPSSVRRTTRDGGRPTGNFFSPACGLERRSLSFRVSTVYVWRFKTLLARCWAKVCTLQNILFFSPFRRTFVRSGSLLRVKCFGLWPEEIDVI